mmetsp:Transcript_17913/g.29873  ORF Transcript_17913/g.29873 Transcript_17913/m.29873 type:complete len:194 (-) Transcript_17913:262-843(-)|eukprot:CAMPEP_0119319492 /NCGR_PEP_ID=MMETSP1333-20130426/49553_1 /TAXON_ID=418940 /ORGANISM="Scyphosphaera apsteinii, Strain RCC1455" /LENGTH=193 /DNA_ID=CAMNT_0007325913 /DNA_START=23 /DNA_END=604 /DNA_ORIENTATION=+
MTSPDIDRILTFWFDGPGHGKHYWAGGPEGQKQLDDLICQQFGTLVEQASQDLLTAEWSLTAPGALALIILLDQWSRNIWRNAPKAFTQDPLAQQICLAGLAKGQHLELSDEPTDRTGSSKRQMFLIPLYHSESVELLEKGLQLINDGVVKYYWGIEGYTHKRIDDMKTFGRIPSRNKARGLESTPKEKAAGY